MTVSSPGRPGGVASGTGVVPLPEPTIAFCCLGSRSVTECLLPEISIYTEFTLVTGQG